MADISEFDDPKSASSGHKLGQLIGDWFEEYYVFPLLSRVAKQLNLYLDIRFLNRTIRGDKIIWRDVDGNAVDYDVVLELGGDADTKGVPVAFIESFWRRGARHSKDKARDDSGKLMPMSNTYPTARFLGIVAAGEFTKPAHELVASRGIDLFYVPKSKIVEAFAINGLIMDYPDNSDENEKQRIVTAFEASFNHEKMQAVAVSLIDLQGQATVDSYTDRVRAKLSALPQEIRFILRQSSVPVLFSNLDEAADFLNAPMFNMNDPIESYVYQITYSDASEFERTATTLDELKALHRQISALAAHMNALSLK